jgi:Ca2+-binding RTX toxin-like protein
MVLKPNTTVKPGVAINLGDQSQDLLVRANVKIQSTDWDAVWASGFNQTITVLGYIKGADDGIDLLDSAYNQVIDIKAGGRVEGGNDAIRVDGEGWTITNAGLIDGGRYGINVQADGIALNRIFNSGSISTGDAAISLEGPANVRLVNSGDIRTTGTDAYDGDDGRDLIRNTGLMVGRIQLADGNDLYDGFQGRVNGLINGGEGNDRFVLGKGADAVHGGNGTDTLDYRKYGSVVVSMDGDFANAGGAIGDTFVSIEKLFGSAKGNDRLDGSDLANDLRGFGGADRLIGDDGDDRLYGGTGRDTLTGGAGLDDFVFGSIKDVGDVITDWISGNQFHGVDQIHINSNFGGGLVDGLLDPSQFRAKAGAAAVDANDRFIYDTTTKKLWFDPDGKGAALAVMVAVVKGDAMTYDDIIIF